MCSSQAVFSNFCEWAKKAHFANKTFCVDIFVGILAQAPQKQSTSL